MLLARCCMVFMHGFPYKLSYFVFYDQCNAALPFIKKGIPEVMWLVSSCKHEMLFSGMNFIDLKV
jgi:hypothetical protein